MPVQQPSGEETDTMLIESCDVPVAETREPGENIVRDVDAQRNICAITAAHASTRANIPNSSYEQVAA
jgi:uncharacterized protein YuzE